jgi:hypothetical protein
VRVFAKCITEMRNGYPLHCFCLLQHWCKYSNVPWQSVLSAASGRNEWTAVQYAAASLLLLNSAYTNTVLEKQMKVVLGRTVTATVNEQETAGRKVLDALVSANMLSVRPHSDWCRDIPAEAYMSTRGSQPSPIVTAPSAAEFHCMGMLRSEFEKTLRCEQINSGTS